MKPPEALHNNHVRVLSYTRCTTMQRALLKILYLDWPDETLQHARHYADEGRLFTNETGVRAHLSKYVMTK